MFFRRTARDRSRRRRPAPGLALAAALLLSASPAAAQALPAGSAPDATFVGAEAERYLRLLQLAGQVPPVQWSVRGLSAGQVARAAEGLGSGHPWARHYAYGAGDGGLRAFAVGPAWGARYNSALPYGVNDGVVWAGRGFTTSGQAGFGVLAGPLTATLAPTAFVAQNRPFSLEPVHPRASPFADPYSPSLIDLPQRFGDGAYGRFDSGESTLRLDPGFVSLGVSSAAQHWGPALEQPMVLGNNAGGFPHVFIGTGGAPRVGIGRLNARLVYGSLAQSEHSFAEPGRERRFMSGVVAAFTPAGLPGLEVGGARFFHTPWPEEGLTAGDLAIPLQGLLKVNLRKSGFGRDSVSDIDNQIASLFARWVMPSAGVEVYAEYGREDHNWDMRDLLLQPDHNSAYVLGVQKLWTTADGRWIVARSEVLNARRSHILAVRRQARFYRHAHTRQGHTHRGQILGAPDGYGGAAGLLAADVYDRSGRWTVRFQRALGGERVPDDRDDGDPPVEGPPDLMVRASLGAERIHYLRGLELTGGMAGVWELNRHFRGDVFNFNAHLGVRARL